MRLLLLTILLIRKHVKCDTTLKQEIEDYFSSSAVQSFASLWSNYKTSFDAALQLDLRDSFNYDSINIIKSIHEDKFILSNGFHVADNAVDLICYGLELRYVPRAKEIGLNTLLAGNVIQLEAVFEDLFVDTSYLVFRNQSSITDREEVLDPSVKSPFTFPQVQRSGRLAITGEDCLLIGSVIVALAGPSAALGHDTLRLTGCKFHIEVNTPGFGIPPVIAPYFSEEKNAELALLLRKTLHDVMLSKLQAVMFAKLNITDILKTEAENYARNQLKLFRKTSIYFSETSNKMNKVSANGNVALKLPDLKINVNEMLNGRRSLFNLSLSNVVLSGLDTAYCDNTGGAFKLRAVKLSDSITFNTLMIRGKLILNNGSVSKDMEFAAELMDVQMDTTLAVSENTDQDKPRDSIKGTYLGWRNTAFSILDLGLFEPDREVAHAIISGYLSEQVPSVLTKYFNKAFQEVTGSIDALSKTNVVREYNDEGQIVNEDNEDKKEWTESTKRFRPYKDHIR